MEAAGGHSSVQGGRTGQWKAFVVLATAFVAVVGIAVLLPIAREGSDRGHRRSASAAAVPLTPIQHVVLIYQENRSFDHVFGAMCAAEHRCDGVTTGELVSGTTIPLSHAADVTPLMNHKTIDQATAVDGGRMDGFENIGSCQGPTYACYSQYQPSDIPVLTALAETYTISDRTFTQHQIPSYTAHLEIAAATTDGFTGDNPSTNMNSKGTPGWGCDSHRDAPWTDRSAQYPVPLLVPACVPDANGAGPYRPSPVQHVPTIMDRLDDAGLTWKIYSNPSPLDTGYPWSICPSFAECLNGRQHAGLVNRSTFISDAAAGALPSYSLVMPDWADSQHDGTSMKQGDNYIAALVSAVMRGPDWASTAIFITYDDCGCFYDHVPPPSPDLGIRVPMVIVSPYAKPHYVDSNVATFTGTMAFVEWNWQLPNLGQDDVGAYDYCNSFTFGCNPTPSARLRAGTTPRITLHPSHVPAHEPGLVTHMQADDDGT
ncbi:MAG TPA: alkaline phosphatase family protein [Acidimicrobiales bacterium]|nr:alkaline phosphatase family protein [Acidimicrobiales bacterium]